MGSAETQGKLWSARAQEWADLQEPMHKPVFDHGFAATKLGAGMKYLDVGCGSGLALQIAHTRGADVAGVDAAEGLVAVAKKRVAHGDIRQAEMEQLPFVDRVFDLVTGFNAFQYAATPVNALREAARVTKKGGHVIIAVWAPPDLTEASKLIAAMKPLMPPPPPGVTPPGPFALSDEKALRALATEAGLTPLTTHDVDAPFQYANIDIAVKAMDSSGVAARAMAHSGEAAVTKAHRDVFEKFVRGDGTVFVQNRFRYLLSSVG